MSQLSDIALIAEVVALGSERAFARLVEAHQETVRRFLRRLTGGDAMLADDLAQETFIRAWRNIGSFRRLSAFETWLLRIAYRVFLDEKSRPQQMASIPSGAEGGGPGDVPGGDMGEAWSVEDDLALALATLSEAERTCVVLQCMEDKPIKDIAAITGLGANTVKSHLLRGKAKLAAFLRSNGYETAGRASMASRKAGRQRGETSRDGIAAYRTATGRRGEREE